MKTFQDFINEIYDDHSDIKVGDKVKLKYRGYSNNDKDKGEHIVSNVTSAHFTIPHLGEDGKPMKFKKNNGVGLDMSKSSSGRVKGVSRTTGHFTERV